MGGGRVSSSANREIHQISSPQKQHLFLQALVIPRSRHSQPPRCCHFLPSRQLIPIGEGHYAGNTTAGSQSDLTVQRKDKQQAPLKKGQQCCRLDPSTRFQRQNLLKRLYHLSELCLRHNSLLHGALLER